MSEKPSEPEFEQAYGDLISALEASSLFQKHPEYRIALKRLADPERVIQFQVIWEDDAHEVQVNTGYRVQFNSCLGPYKGGTRFHPTVTISILKFLALEQTFKNALTGLNLGGAKGGSDFDPKGKSDNEIRRFCVAYMNELSPYIGPNKDIPAGDIGVTSREVGWMFGAYKVRTSHWECCITGKPLALGGTLLKAESTGYGLIYYLGHMINYVSNGRETLHSRKVAISGSGNVAQYAALKAIELGATIVSLSDSLGTVTAVSEKGIGLDDLRNIMQLKKHRKQLHELKESHKESLRYFAGSRPWKHVNAVDIALPCATQNELSESDAEWLVAAGCRYVAEGSNMGCTQKAIGVFERHRQTHRIGEAVWFAPGKAANVGGSAVSGFEMAQNSQRVSWSTEKVDKKLRAIMASCFQSGLSAAEQYAMAAEKRETDRLPSLLAGSNIAGFIKVAEAMLAEGDWWQGKGLSRRINCKL